MPTRPGIQRDVIIPWHLGAERLILPVSWVVLLVLAIGTTLLERQHELDILLAVFLFLGVACHAYLSRLGRIGFNRRALRLASALVHGTLSTIGVLLTGGAESRFAPLFTLVLATIPMRFHLGTAMIIGSGFITAFFLASLVIPGSPALVPLLIFTCLNFLALLMAGSLVRRNEISQNRLIQTAVHELRNPMSVIKGNLSLVRRRLVTGRPAGEVSPAAETMEREIDRLSSLVDEITEAFLIRTEQLTLRRERIPLTEVVASALKPFRAMQETRQIVYEETAGLFTLGDAARLGEVIGNLVGNALQYSPEGSEVWVRLQAIEGKALLTVKDAGPGIQRTHLAVALDPFYRLSDETGRYPRGMGLGLYICQNIIQRHGGRIWVESDGASGATFCVELPLLPSATPCWI